MSAAQLAVGFAVLAMVNGVAACATQQLSFTVLAPAEVNLKSQGVRSLAVSDFTGPEQSGRKVAELFTADLAQGKHFKLVEREKLLAMEREQALGMIGVVDERMAAKAGKLLGVDALVVGNVSAFSVEDKPYTRTVMKQRRTGQYRTECRGNDCSKVEITEEVAVQEQHHVRNGTVSIAYRVIKAETGEVLAGRQETGSYHYDSGAGSGRELGREEVLSTLAQEVVAKLAADIQPHAVQVNREFENGGWLFGDPAVKQGIEYIRANRLDDGIQHWEAVVKENPVNGSAWYNLGLAYEMAGHFEKAEKAYRTAEGIDPKPRYIQAVSDLHREVERRKKLEEQTK
ncbi:MAG: DUF6340 family protein [Nitrospirota bacterium]